MAMTGNSVMGVSHDAVEFLVQTPGDLDGAGIERPFMLPLPFPPLFVCEPPPGTLNHPLPP